MFHFEPFVWSAAGGTRRLGHLPGGTKSGEAYAVTRDGSLVVGNSDSSHGETEAFRRLQGLMGASTVQLVDTYDTMVLAAGDEATLVAGWQNTLNIVSPLLVTMANGSFNPSVA